MRTRYTPDNILQGKRIANLIRPRNLAEGVVWCFALAYIFHQIPFASLFRWILIIVLGATALILNCIGIKNQSFSESVINYIRIRKHIKKISYRRMNNVKKENEPLIKDGHITAKRETIAAGWLKAITKK